MPFGPKVYAAIRIGFVSGTETVGELTANQEGRKKITEIKPYTRTACLTEMCVSKHSKKQPVVLQKHTASN